MTYKLPPGSIIISTAEMPRFNAFWRDMFRIKAAYPQVDLKWSASVDLCFNWNDALRRRKPGGQWVCFMGDDHTFEPDFIERLWQHQRECIVPLVLKRSFPHTPVIYGPNHSQEMPKPAQAGLMEIFAAGGAGMLVTEGALSRVKPPWFEFHPNNTERAGEDLYFCQKLREQGVRIWVDLETWLGHITPVEIWPARSPQGEWGTQYKNVLRADVF